MHEGDYDTVFHPAEHPLRGTWARIGIVALNLIQPGMGLVRLGRLPLGLLLVALPLILSATLLWLLSNIPTLTFEAAILGVATLVALGLCIYLYAFAASWRQSRQLLPRRGQAWRWHGLVALYVLATAGSWPITDRVHDNYKPYYIPAESMAPTFLVGDRILAKMSNYRLIQHGDSVIVRARETDYVKRVAGLPGDRIGMHNGIVSIDGQSIPQSLNGKFEFAGSSPAGTKSAMLYDERFPGEKNGHSIIDSGSYPKDDMPELILGPDQYFLLGDNRDNSVDSRFPADQMGLGLVSANAISGKVLFRYWRSGEGLKEGRP